MEKIYTLNGDLLKKLLTSGYVSLERDYEYINDLNVFPVPDGDTGTNMKITFYSGLSSTSDLNDLDSVADAFARGTLFGARGNSGVLLSQYFKGFALVCKDKKELDIFELVEAFSSGYKTAYQCAINPVEGTILTVAREGIENVKQHIDEKTDLESFFALFRKAMSDSLNNTPNLLPVLKESGVIDSGGRGLLSIVEGIYNYFKDGEADFRFSSGDDSPKRTIDYSLFNEYSALDYGYCFEFLLQLLVSKIDVNNFDLDDFIDKIKVLGESVVVTQTGTIVKVHIHTKTPSHVIEFAQKYGEFLSVKMENMALQHNHVIAKKRKKIAIISIASGDGIIDLFKELGSDIVINGGQTMNTSTEEIIEAVKRANADNVILLPNNSNIVLACQQAQELYKDSSIYVVKTKSIQEGYYGLSMMVPSEDPLEVVEQISSGMEMIISGFVARAIKDFKYQNKDGHINEYLEYFDGKIISANVNRKEALLELIDAIPDIDDKEVLSIFYGQEVKLDEVNELVEKINEKYPYLEVGVINGKQDIYDYLIGVNV